MKLVHLLLSALTLLAVTSLVVAGCVTPRSGEQSTGSIGEIRSNLESACFKAEMLERGEKSGTKIRYSPGAMEILQVPGDLPKYARVIEGEVYITSNQDLGWLSLREGKAAYYFLFSVYDPRFVLDNLENQETSRENGTLVVQGRISTKVLLEDKNVPEETLESLKDLSAKLTLRDSVVEKMGLVLSEKNNPTVEFSYPGEGFEIREPELVRKTGEETGDELARKEEMARTNASTLSKIIVACKDLHGKYPSELDKSVAEEVDMTWPTNPYFDRPVKEGIHPGDFVYEKVGKDYLLKAYAWDSIVLYHQPEQQSYIEFKPTSCEAGFTQITREDMKKHELTRYILENEMNRLKSRGIAMVAEKEEVEEVVEAFGRGIKLEGQCYKILTGSDSH